jgi:hypothetical protein
MVAVGLPNLDDGAVELGVARLADDAEEGVVIGDSGE